MATWSRVATSDDLVGERTKNFQLWAAPEYGLHQRGISFPYLVGKDRSDQTGMPMIDWSSPASSGENTGHVGLWTTNGNTTATPFGDTTGIVDTGAYFELFGSQEHIMNEPTPTSTQANFMTEGVMGQVLAVPSGGKYHNGGWVNYGKHKISLSGVVSNHHSADDSYASYMHINLWRAYAPGLITIGDDGSLDPSIRFRLVQSTMNVAGGPIYVPNKSDSSRIFKCDDIELLLDPEACTSTNSMCYYLVSCFVSKYDYNGYYSQYGRQWPFIGSSNGSGYINPAEGSSRRCSLKFDVEISYKPWTGQP